MRTLFLDAGFVIAQQLSTDQHHERALACWAQIAQERARLITTSFVFAEVIAFFSGKGRPELGIAAGRWMLASRVTTLIHVDSALFGAGWQHLQTRPDKTYSLTDCISFILMQRHGVREALTFDHHFTQAGFIRLPA
jgi:uncharacterized protein